MSAEPLRLFLCGDVMTGRGVDQALAHPGRPALFEAYVRDARDYVRLAEKANGPIPRPVDPAYVWGDALDVLERAGTDARIINLETTITASDDAWPGKGIHYRMHPRNIGCLTAARIDCCCLANNHVLDWGYAGLAETLRVLDAVGIAHAGAGRNAAAAAAPAILDVPGKGRVLVFAFGAESSGVPPEWAAGDDRPGINLLEDVSDQSAMRLASRIRALKRPEDVIVASIHWGPNWGYDVPERMIGFAHRLVAEGVDVVHGHSSHHPLGIEVFRERLILYGSGDFLDDYEGIKGYEEFRPDLRLLYLVRVSPGEGRLAEARLITLQPRRFRLRRAADRDVIWTCQLLNELGTAFDTQVERAPDDSLLLRWT